MKKLAKALALLLALALVFALTACKSSDGTNSGSGTSKDSGGKDQSSIFNFSIPDGESEEEPDDESDEEPDDGSDEEPESGNWYDYEGISVLLPDGFTITSTQGVYMAIPADYPTHSDNITFSAASGASIDIYTEENMLPTLQQMLGDVQNFKMQISKKDGVDYAKLTYDFNLGGVSMSQIVYSFVFSGKAVTVTYTSTTGAYDSAFAFSGENIRV